MAMECYNVAGCRLQVCRWQVGKLGVMMVNHKRALLYLFLFVGLLGACAEGEEVVRVNTAVPTPPPTIEPTATETAVPVSVVEETAVPVPTVTSSPTATPTPQDLFLRPTNLPTVPFEAGVEYQLVQPPFESLLDVIRREADFEDIHVSEYQGRSPNYPIYSMVERDIKNFYTESLPVSARILNDISLTSYYFGWYHPPEVLLYLLEIGILQYLNQLPKELSNGLTIDQERFKLISYSIELDNDLTSEWIVQFESHVFRARIFLLLDQTESGEYELIPSSLPTLLGRSYSDGWSELVLDKDFTGDGTNEIVIDTWTTYAGSPSGRVVDVFSWADGLINLGQITDDRYSDFEIEDQDGDGLSDLQVTVGYGSRFGCHWEAIDLYRWPNQIAQPILGNHERPDTAVCNLSAAVTPYSQTWNPEKNDQYDLLERAVAQMREDESVSLDLVAYAELELAMAYAEQNRYDEARAIINTIYDLPEQSEFIQYIQTNDGTGSVIDLCRNLVADAHQVLETDMEEYLNMNATRGRGFDYREPDKSMICDLKYLALTQLQNASLPSSQPPQDSLLAMDFQFSFAQSANLDDDPDLEWIGILEPEAPWLVIFDADNGQWVAHFVDDIFSAPVFDLDFGQQKITNDDNLSTLVTIAAESHSTLTTSEYEVFLIDKVDEEYVIVDANYLYDEQPVLRDLPDDFFNLDSEQPTIIEPGWKQLEGFLEERERIGSYIEGLTDLLLNQTDLTIPEKITQLLNYLPTDNPDAQPYIEHLTYLLGYFYELSGEEETAVSTYLGLIQQYPTSPWSWLAWARLESVADE